MSNSKKKRKRTSPQDEQQNISVSSQVQKGNGLSRSEQVTYGLKIEVLIGKELKFFANVDYQAPADSKVAVMIITTDNLSHIWRIRRYILNKFQMIDSKITGHGSIAGTLKYNLSEISVSSFEKVEEHYKLVFPEGHKKVDGKHPHLVAEGVVVPVVSKDTEQSISSKPQKERKMKSESRTLGLSQFLHAFLCSDRKINHPSFDSKECHLSHFLAYRRDLVGSSDVLNCTDEAIAIKVEAGIEWLLGSKFVAREGSQVLVDLSEWKKRERRVGSVNFTLPPNQLSSSDEVAKRLARANITSKPTSVRKEENVFLVTYHWKTTGAMVFDIISEMGWKAGLDSHGNLLVYPNDAPKGEEVRGDTDTSQPAEAIQSVVEEEVPNVPDSVKDEVQVETGTPVSNVPDSSDVTVPEPKVEKPAVVVKKRAPHVPTVLNNRLVRNIENNEPLGTVKSEKTADVPFLPHLVHNKIDAFNELSKLYDNPKLFSMLPESMQNEVELALKDKYMEEHPVDYAAYLLALLKK